MWNYEKRLQYPVKITQTNPKIAQIIISQFGGPDGELAASMRYLSQRYTMPYKEVTGTLTDIGTEELAHMEMICAIVYQLTKNLTPEEIERSGFAPYYVDHTLALWPSSSPKAIRSPISMKTWLPSRKPGPPTTTSCVLSKTRKSAIPSVSFASGRSYITSGSAKASGSSRRNWTAGTSTHSIPNSTADLHPPGEKVPYSFESFSKTVRYSYYLSVTSISVSSYSPFVWGISIVSVTVSPLA